MRSVTETVNFREGGFTLLQVIMALAIISVILVPMVNSYVSSWQQSLAAEKRSRAKMLAHQVLEEQMADDYGEGTECDLSNIPQTDDFECEITDEEVEGGPDEVERIEVTIHYPSLQADGNRSVFCTETELEDSTCPDLITYRTNRSTS